MDIQSLSMHMAQARVQEEAAIRLQAMALSNIREQMPDLAQLMDSTQIINDPSIGNNVDILA